MIKLAIDAMGGDFGPSIVVPACINSLKKNKNICITLIGDQVAIKSYLTNATLTKYSDRLEIIHTDEKVLMSESPSSALRMKKKSSMRLAINMVKQKEADACVSAGNTGALIAISRFVLKTIPGIDRAAIIASLPIVNGKCRALDLGANVDTCAEHLLQFAVMGATISETVDGIKNPKVGLLNVGVEEIKGNDLVKQTSQLISESGLVNYIGYVEGDSFFVGGADVIVCNGFVGNVALKSGEGMARRVREVIYSEFKKNFITRIMGLMAYPVFTKISKEIDPSKYNGATLVGLNGIVIKSHGSANALAFEAAISEAISEVQHKIPDLITTRVGEIL
ncbi:MAG: phosphate acyltransferase PlsX [Legionellales bacterium]|nr:phosphate acyltransferase PlsX [Legionellales bacterium]